MTEAKNAEAELWRPAAALGFEVSSLGRIKNLNTGRVFTPKPHTHGYCRLATAKDPKQKSYFVHRLVAEAFIGKIPDGLQVNHINGIKTDNRAGNLEIVTQRKNLLHAQLMGIHAAGEKHGSAKLTKENVLEILSSKESGSVLAKKFGVDQSTVRRIRGGSAWTVLSRQGATG